MTYNCRICGNDADWDKGHGCALGTPENERHRLTLKERDVARAELLKLQDDLLQGANREVMAEALIDRLKGELGEAKRLLGSRAKKRNGACAWCDSTRVYWNGNTEHTKECEYAKFLAAPPPAESTPVQATPEPAKCEPMCRPGTCTGCDKEFARYDASKTTSPAPQAAPGDDDIKRWVLSALSGLMDRARALVADYPGADDICDDIRDVRREVEAGLYVQPAPPDDIRERGVKCECGAGRNHVMYGVCKLAAKTAEDLTFERFAEVNRRRCESYNGFGESLQLSSKYTEAHWALSIASEAGEVADAILGWSGLKRSKAGKTKEDVGRELADVVTYCDLLASKLGFRLSRLIMAKFNEINERCGFGNRFAIGSHPVPAALEAKGEPVTHAKGAKP